MCSTRLPVGFSAWDVASNAAACASASVARAIGIGVLAMSSTRLPIGFSAWDVASNATACASTSTSAGAAAVALVAGGGVVASAVALVVAGAVVGVLAMLST